ncbi:MAG: methionine adenosyltransferase [Pseudomonadota bacterium]
MAIEIETMHGPSLDRRPVEIVERKGLGHPDTICDMVSECFSRALSRHYLDRFGLVLHHNVDKALLSAGRSEASFGGGRILAPIELYLAGRASVAVGAEVVPVAEIAEQAVHHWLTENLHALDAATAVRVHTIVHPGSAELVDLFRRQREANVKLANDTSIGVGFAPLSELERIVLAVERALNAPELKRRHPETGEDVKVMGVRRRDSITLTIACAFVGRFLADMAAYVEAKERLGEAALAVARSITRRQVEVAVNAADDVASGTVYLTVSGTSAEAGDDGETGRGNRSNGLITPYRPMTLEAVAGKNAITHVGKLYNAAADGLARALVAEVPGVSETECRLVSRIGTPIDRPQLVHLCLRTADGDLPPEIARQANEVAEREIARIPDLWRSFLAGSIPVA